MNLFINLIKNQIGKIKNWFGWSRPKLKFPLEIHLADHCNLNCKGCSHYSPISNLSFKTVEELKLPLKRLSHYNYFFNEIRLLGGEPLLNPNLLEIISYVRLCFPLTTIKIITNGILLLNEKIIDNNFWKTLEKNGIILSITLYPIKLNYEKIFELCSINKIKYIIYANKSTHNAFNLFLLDALKSGSKKNFYYCRDSICYQLVGNKIFTCPQCAYVNKLNSKFGTNFVISKNDYLDINNMNLFKLIIFQNKPKSFCRYCVFPRVNIDWDKSKMAKDEWIKEVQAK